MGWICDGIPKDGLEHPEGSGSHSPYENPDIASFCFRCELPKTAVVVTGNPSTAVSGGSSQPSLLNSKTLPIVLGIPIVIGVGAFFAPSLIKNLPPFRGNPSGIQCSKQSVELTSGEENIFKDTITYDAKLGIESFEKKDYEQAETFFEREMRNSPSRPELVIYRNNAQARSAEVEPYKIAAVVSLEQRGDSALEILRGIADAQSAFNEKQTSDSPLLEVVIYNEADRPEQAQCVAQTIAQDDSILAVIGHSSSKLSLEALSFYTKANVAMIAPTSTSTQLQQTNFFRTVPSDAAAGKKLANYLQQDLKKDPKSVAVFYSPGDPYSESLYNAFINELGTTDDIRTIDLTPAEFDAESEVNQLIKDKIEVAVLFPSTDTRPRAIGVANENKKRLTLLGGDTLYDPEILKQGSENTEGLVLAVPWYQLPDAKAENYSYRAEEQWIGRVSWRTASSYDATQALIEILEESIDREGIIDKLGDVKLSDKQTSGLALEFERGERQTEPLLVEVCSKAPKPFDTGFGFVPQGKCTVDPPPTPTTPTATPTPTPKPTSLPIPPSTPVPTWIPTPTPDWMPQPTPVPTRIPTPIPPPIPTPVPCEELGFC